MIYLWLKEADHSLDSMTFTNEYNICACSIDLKAVNSKARLPIVIVLWNIISYILSARRECKWDGGNLSSRRYTDKSKSISR